MRTFTNTMLTGPYRGAGRPEAAYVIETMVDMAARELGIDPAELRRRNTIPADAMPYKTALGLHLRLRRLSARTSTTAWSMADYKGFEARRAKSAKHGKLRGIGISTTVEASNAGLIEHAEMRFDPGGTLTVSMGTHDHGQGHGTAFRQIVADKLGIDRQIACATNTATPTRSRSAPALSARARWSAGGTALLLAADKVIAKGKKIAAHMLEAAEHDIVFEDGKFTVAGTDKTVGIVAKSRAIASTREHCRTGMEPGLFESGTFDGGERTFPNGCHIVEVEIDEDDRRGRDRALPRGRRRRPHDQSAAGRGPDPRRHRAGRRPGADREHRLRQSPASSSPARSWITACRAPTISARSTLGENEVPTKTNPLGVKGAGEVRHRRRAARGDECGQRRAGADRRALCPDAGNVGEGLARDQGGARRRDGEAIGSDCIVWPGASSVAMTRTKG